jgi:hypothetical protein
VTLLQLSWFVAALVMLSVIPDQEPPVPGATFAPTAAGEPESEKSACVQGGFVLSAWRLKFAIDADTDVTYWLKLAGFVKLPLSATEPPGYRPDELDVWFTVTATLPAAVDAEPDPLPDTVQ